MHGIRHKCPDAFGIHTWVVSGMPFFLDLRAEFRWSAHHPGEPWSLSQVRGATPPLVMLCV